VWTSAISSGLAYAWGFVLDAASVLGLILIFALAGALLSRIRP